MSNPIVPGSSADVNVKVRALGTDPNVSVQYKTVIFKKNLVSGVNTLTQEMISAQNTKYVIKYDYVLNSDVTIPENCILEFDGGSISGAYTITGQNTSIEAGLVKVFNTDITLAGSWKVDKWFVEWFGADATLDDNAPIINSTINILEGLGKRYNLYLTTSYIIKDTIWLRQYTNIIGSKLQNCYQTASPLDSVACSGFILDFANRNKYAIDTYIEINNEKCSFDYNQMFINIDSISGYSWGTNRKTSAKIKNINIQLKQSRKTDGPVFGGIRLLDIYFSEIKNICIYGVAVGISFNNSWGCDISNITMTACLCGLYFGKYNTDVGIKNFTVESNWYAGTWTWTGEVIWKDASKLFPQYDANGNRPTDAGYATPIEIHSVGVISESFETDASKLYFQDCGFQNLDAVLLAESPNGNDYIYFNHCYDESIRKVLLWTYSGQARWLNPCYKGGAIYPYVFATETGFIKADAHLKPTCYPSQNTVSYKHNYEVADANLYDKYTKDTTYPQNVSNLVSANKKYTLPFDSKYYIGFDYSSSVYNDNISGLRTGLSYEVYSPLKNIITAFNPKFAHFYVVKGTTDFSCGGILFENKQYIFDYDVPFGADVIDKYVAANEPIKIKNCNFVFNRLSLLKSFTTFIDEKPQKSVSLEYIFECYGKNKIFSDAYTDATEIVCLAGDEPIELEITLSNSWAYTNQIIKNPNFGTKYKVTVTTKKGTRTFTNPTKPTAGLTIGDVFVENGTPIYWNGTEWVDATGTPV